MHFISIISIFDSSKMYIEYFKKQDQTRAISLQWWSEFKNYLGAF